MDEREKVVMLWTILSYVKEIRDGGDTPGPWAIQQRLRFYAQNAENS